MSDASDLRRVLPYLQAVEKKLDAQDEHLKKQDAKLSEHDRWFAQLDRDLDTLKNLHQAQIDHIDETIRRLRAGMNGK